MDIGSLLRKNDELLINRKRSKSANFSHLHLFFITFVHLDVVSSLLGINTSATKLKENFKRWTLSRERDGL